MKRLNRDVIALFESVSDEFATIDHEARERDPESVVGEHLNERTFLVEDEHVEQNSNNDVEDNTDEEDDEEDSSAVHSAVRAIRDFFSASSRCVIAEDITTVRTALSTALKVTYRVCVADKIDDSTHASSSSSAFITTTINDHKALALLNGRVICRHPFLSFESADDGGCVEGSAGADGGVRIVAVEGGVATEVHVVSTIALLKGHCVGLSFLVPDRLEVVLVRLLGVLVADDGHTLVLCKSKTTKNKNNK